MIKIRRNVFETNSSSTHSLVIMSKDEYKKFIDGDLYYNTVNALNCTKKLITIKERDLLHQEAVRLDEEENCNSRQLWFSEDFIDSNYCTSINVKEINDNTLEVDLEYFYG